MKEKEVKPNVGNILQTKVPKLTMITKSTLQKLGDLNTNQLKSIPYLEALLHAYNEIGMIGSDDAIVIDEYYQQLRSLAPNFKQMNGKYPMTNIENVKIMMEFEKIACKYNEMNMRYELSFGKNSNVTPGYEDHHIGLLTDYFVNHRLQANYINKFLPIICHDNTYHPVRDWFNSIKWDGIDRLQEFYDIFTYQDDADIELCHMYFKKFLIQAVAAIFNPHFQQQGMLTLQGGENIGKSRFLPTIVPIKSWVKTGETINPDKADDVLRILTAWLVELGEMDSITRKADTASVKRWITNEYDDVRAPYAILSKNRKRMTCCLATLNPSNFLVDDANRRFWIIPVLSINLNHMINIEQLWAQAKNMYDNGDSYWLNEDELTRVNTDNLKYGKSSTITDILDSMQLVRLPDGHKPSNRMTATAVLHKCGISNPTDLQRSAAMKYLSQHNLGRASMPSKCHSTGNAWEVMSENNWLSN